jgi:hypothetical protein
MSPQIWPMLASVLRSTTAFKHLSLQCFRFHGENMRALISCLKQQDNPVPLSSVSELSLSDCLFQVGTRRLFLDFMHTRATPYLTDSSNSELLPLRKLNLCDGSISIRPECRLSTRTLVSMLCMQGDTDEQKARDDTHHEWHPTIGSQIESLTLDYVNDLFPRFFSRMAQRSARIRLKELKATGLMRQDVIGLVQCLSQVQSLRALDVSLYDTSALPILIALRENGNILSVSIERTRTDEADLASKVTQAYCERNKCLDGLLLESSRSTEPDQDCVAATNGAPSRRMEANRSVQRFGRPHYKSRIRSRPRCSAAC